MRFIVSYPSPTLSRFSMRFSLLDLLFPPRPDARRVEDVTMDIFLSLIEPSLFLRTEPGTVTLLSFHHPDVRAAIHEAKYHGTKRAFDLLAEAACTYLADCDERSKDAVLIPVPLGKERLRERGFNQCEEIGRRIRSTTSIPLEMHVLRRTKETPSQVSLKKEDRLRNMEDAFTCNETLSNACTYLLLDDVVTTGATMQAAICALREAGARHILPIALAH